MVELVNLFARTFLARICDSAMWLQLPRPDEPEVHSFPGSGSIVQAG
jgi:hypothetical protein